MDQETLNLVKQRLAQHLEMPLQDINDDTVVPDPAGLQINVKMTIGKSFCVDPSWGHFNRITLGKLIAYNEEMAGKE